MTDARFLSNNSVTSEANHVKCKTLMQGRWAYKNCRNRSKKAILFLRREFSKTQKKSAAELRQILRIVTIYIVINSTHVYARDNILPVLHYLRGDAFVSSFICHAPIRLAVRSTWCIIRTIIAFKIGGKLCAHHFVVAERFKEISNAVVYGGKCRCAPTG